MLVSSILSVYCFGIFQKLYTFILLTMMHPSSRKSGTEKMQELTRNKRGIQSDKLLLETVNSHPGLSQYELAKMLDWQSGRVDGAIRRLVNGNQILIKSTQRNGRLVNLVYLKENKPANVIEVPISLLKIGNRVWADSAFVYALDSTTIGVAGQEMPEWKEVACFTETIPTSRKTKKK